MTGIGVAPTLVLLCCTYCTVHPDYDISNIGGTASPIKAHFPRLFSLHVSIFSGIIAFLAQVEKCLLTGHNSPRAFLP